jgi:hypothetical protein
MGSRFLATTAGLTVAYAATGLVARPFLSQPLYDLLDFRSAIAYMYECLFANS